MTGQTATGGHAVTERHTMVTRRHAGTGRTGTGRTGTGGHAALLRQVRLRAERVLAAARDGHRPEAELTALTDYARSELRRQAADEERRLRLASAPPDVSRALARDHARLVSCVDALARAASGEQPLSAAQLTVTTRDFVAQLERHLRADELASAWNIVAV